MKYNFDVERNLGFDWWLGLCFVASYHGIRLTVVRRRNDEGKFINSKKTAADDMVLLPAPK